MITPNEVREALLEIARMSDPDITEDDLNAVQLPVLLAIAWRHLTGKDEA